AQGHRAGQVRGEHVRGELDAAELEAERAGRRVGEQGLRDTGDALEQDVSADEQRRQQVFHGTLLADDDLADLAGKAVAQLAHGRDSLSSFERTRPTAITSASLRAGLASAAASGSGTPRRAAVPA